MQFFVDIGITFFRIIIVSIIALGIIRGMGNRSVGHFSPIDFVIMVGIGDIIITVALTEHPTFYQGVAALIALLVLQRALSYLALKSVALRRILEGIPITFIENGKVLRENLVKTNFNYDDLRQELHKQGLDMRNIQDIKIARLESCGDFSVIKTPETEPLSRQDIEIYLNNLVDNPLHPAGKTLLRWEKFMEDVHVLAEYIKKEESMSKQVERKENL